MPAQLVASSQITLLDLNDAIISGTQPASPVIGTLWIKNSVVPSELYRWSGTGWVLQSLSLAGLDPTQNDKINDSAITLANLSDDGIITLSERDYIKDKITSIIGYVPADTSSISTLAVLDASGKGEVYSVRKEALNAGLLSTDALYIAVGTQYTNLSDYLNGLNPKPWNTSSIANITIVPSTWRDNWLKYYQAILDLRQAIANKLKQNVDNIQVGGRNLFIMNKAVQGYIDPSNNLVSTTGANITSDYIAVKAQETYIFNTFGRGGNHRLTFYDANKTWLSRETPTVAGNDPWIKTMGVGVSYIRWSPDAPNIFQEKYKIEKGNKATDWTPAPEDVDAALAKAQSDANTANLLLEDIASDNKLTASEKKEVKREWDLIAGEKVSLDTQATLYGITTGEPAAYTLAYNTLNTYLNVTGSPYTLLADLNLTSNIVGTTFRANFKAYYDARTALLKKIQEVAKSSGESYVQSRGENLVTNGTGLLGNNTNFPGFLFDGTEAFGSNGSFVDTISTTRTTAEFMPVDISRTYKLSFYAKAIKGNPTKALTGHYSFLDMYDADKLSIGAEMVNPFKGTLTTLARDLKVGDTVVYLTSAANYNNAVGANTHNRKFMFWGYKNSFGYEYPAETYTRYFSAYDTWSDGAVDFVNNTITLRVPWSYKNPNDAAGTWKAGHKVSNGTSGGYTYKGLSNTQVPETWTQYTGVFAPSDFRAGTASVKIGWLNHYSAGQTGSTVDNNKIMYSNIVFGLDNASKQDVQQVRTDLRLTAPLPTAITMDANGFTATVTGDSTKYARLDYRGLYVQGGAIDIRTSGAVTNRGVVLDSTGLKAYDANGVQKIAINTDGTSLFDGVMTIGSLDAATKGVLANADSNLINLNPFFLDWTGTYPAGYSTVSGTGFSKVVSSNGTGNAIQYVVGAGGNHFLTPNTISNLPFYQYVTIEVAFCLTSGTIDGAGVLFRYQATTSVDHSISLKTSVTPELNKWYTVTKTIKQPINPAGFSGYTVWPMGGWTTFGTVTAKTIQFDAIKTRPATQQEIDVFEGKDTWDKAGTSIQIATAYNTVKIDATNGLVAQRTDNKVKTTVNATDGFKIEKSNDGGVTWPTKLFSVDTNGVIQATGLVIDATSSIGGTQANAVVNNAATGAQASVDLANLSIGGRNLVQNSMKFIPSTGASAATGVTATITAEGYMQVVAAAGNGGWHTNWLWDGTGIEESLNEGDDVVFSFEMKSTGHTFKPQIYPKDGMGYITMQGTMSTNFSTIWATAKWKKASPIGFFFGWGNVTGTTIIKSIKIEKGTRPTAWTPAIEETVQTTTSYQGVKIDGNNGITVSNAVNTLTMNASKGLELKKGATNIFSLDASGNLILTGNVTMTGGTLDASKVIVSNLNADSITAGTLRVVGTQMARGTDFSNSNFEFLDGTKKVTVAGQYEVIPVAGPDGGYLQFNKTVFSNIGAYTPYFPLTSSTTYTFSFEVYHDSDVFSSDCGIYYSAGPVIASDLRNPSYFSRAYVSTDTPSTWTSKTDLADGWTRYTKTFVTDANTAKGFITFTHNGTKKTGLSTCYVKWRKVMLNQGTIVTSWQAHNSEQAGVITATVIEGSVIRGSTIDIGNGAFAVSKEGILTAKGANIDGALKMGVGSSLSAAYITAGILSGASGATTLNLSDGSFRLGGSQFFRIGNSDTDYGLRYNYSGSKKLEINGETLSSNYNGSRTQRTSITNGAFTSEWFDDAGSFNMETTINAFNGIESVFYTNRAHSAISSRLNIGSNSIRADRNVSGSAYDGFLNFGASTRAHGYLAGYKNALLQMYYMDLDMMSNPIINAGNITFSSGASYGINLTNGTLSNVGNIIMSSGASYDIDMTNGNIKNVGNIIMSTGNIDMANSDLKNVNHITIADPGPGEGLEWLGGSGWIIHETNDTGTLNNAASSLQIFTGKTRRFSFSNAGNFFVTGTSINIVGSGGTFQTEGTTTINSNGATLGIGKDTSASPNYIASIDIYNRTYASGTTVIMTTLGTLGRVSSATKYKLNIESVDEDAPSKILELEPKTWFDKPALESYSSYLASISPVEIDGTPKDIDDSPMPDIGEIRRVSGLIAEEVEAVGLSEFVLYGEPDENGNREIESLMYDRLWVLLIPIVKELKEKNKKLKEENKALDDRLNKIEAILFNK